MFRRIQTTIPAVVIYSKRQFLIVKGPCPAFEAKYTFVMLPVARLVGEGRAVGPRVVGRVLEPAPSGFSVGWYVGASRRPPRGPLPLRPPRSSSSSRPRHPPLHLPRIFFLSPSSSSPSSSARLFLQTPRPRPRLQRCPACPVGRARDDGIRFGEAVLDLRNKHFQILRQTNEVQPLVLVVVYSVVPSASETRII